MAAIKSKNLVIGAQTTTSPFLHKMLANQPSGLTSHTATIWLSNILLQKQGFQEH